MGVAVARTIGARDCATFQNETNWTSKDQLFRIGGIRTFRGPDFITVSISNRGIRFLHFQWKAFAGGNMQQPRR